MDPQTSARWLFDRAGPVIRFRVSQAYGAALPPLNREVLENALLQDRTVQFWLNNLKPYAVLAEEQQRGEGLGDRGNSSFLHGATDQNIEVVFPKLGQLGLRAGMPVLDEKIGPWLAVLEAELERDPLERYARADQFLSLVYAHYDHRLIIASALAQVGCAHHPAAAAVIQARLDAIHAVVVQGSFDIYEAPGRVSVQPKAWADHLLKADLYADGLIRLPFVHDICNFARLYGTAGADTRRKIDAIIHWALQPEHQALGYNYGYIRCPDGRGKSVGHRLALPGYNGLDGPGFDPRRLVFTCWLMGHFPAARAHPWFQRSLAHLEQFALDPGIYAFPAGYLPESKGRGYWVHGERMGLGEDRRNPGWRAVESTFWMLLLKGRSE